MVPVSSRSLGIFKRPIVPIECPMRGLWRCPALAPFVSASLTVRLFSDTAAPTPHPQMDPFLLPLSLDWSLFPSGPRVLLHCPRPHGLSAVIQCLCQIYCKKRIKYNKKRAILYINIYPTWSSACRLVPCRAFGGALGRGVGVLGGSPSGLAQASFPALTSLSGVQVTRSPLHLHQL